MHVRTWTMSDNDFYSCYKHYYCRFPAFFTGEFLFVTSCLLSCTQSNYGGHFFSFRVDPFSELTKANLTDASPEIVLVLFKMHDYIIFHNLKLLMI